MEQNKSEIEGRSGIGQLKSGVRKGRTPCEPNYLRSESLVFKFWVGTSVGEVIALCALKVSGWKS